MNAHAATRLTVHVPAPRVVVPLPTRERILAAARALLRAHGYAGFTMEGVALESGLTRRTLYNRFADREALYCASRAALLTEFEPLLPSAVEGEAPAAVERFVALSLDALAHPAHVELARSAEFDSLAFPWVAELYETRVLRPLCEAIQHHLGGPHPDTRSHAEGLVAMLRAAVASDRPNPVFTPCELAAIFLRRLGDLARWQGLPRDPPTVRPEPVEGLLSARESPRS